MTIDPFPLTRRQIAEFTGNNHETIRRIERLFEVAGEETPGLIEGLEIMAGNSVALVNALMTQIEAYAKATNTNFAVLDAKLSSLIGIENEIENIEFMMNAINRRF